MAYSKVSDLTELTTTDGAEELLVNDGGTSKKVTIANLLHDESIDSDHYVDGSIDNAHLADDAVDSDEIAEGAVDLAHMSSESVDEDNLYISNAGSNDQFLQKQSGNDGGLTWATPTDTTTDVVDDTSPQLGGDLDCNGSQIQWSQGADVASDTALAVLTDGNYFDVTGTTTITSINTTGGVGTLIKLHFDDALTLTHDATDLILPGGANITTAAGDEAEFIEYATGDYRCTNYSKASGKAVILDISNSDVNASAAIAQSKLATLAITDSEVANDALSGDKIDGGTISNFASTGIDDTGSNNVGIVIGANRKVGIGSASSPIYFLDVAGDALITRTGTASQYMLGFKNDNGIVGSIYTDTTTTSYNTSSDYRLKENVVPMTGSIDRLKELNPSRFNFIVDEDKTVDGFLAHEAGEVVPEAVSGVKDGMTDMGNITDTESVIVEENVAEPSELQEGQVWTKTGEVEDYQGIDQSKLVPLLVAALQEAIARIETLENN